MNNMNNQNQASPMLLNTNAKSNLNFVRDTYENQQNEFESPSNMLKFTSKTHNYI